MFRISVNKKWLQAVAVFAVIFTGITALADTPLEEQSHVRFDGLFRTVDQIHVRTEDKKLIIQADNYGDSDKYKGANLADVQATIDLARKTGSLIYPSVPNMIAPDSYPILIAMVRLHPQRLKFVNAVVNKGGYFDLGHILEVREVSTNALITTSCDGCKTARVDELISLYKSRVQTALQRNVPVEVNSAQDATHLIRIQAVDSPRPNAEQLHDGEQRDKFWSLKDDEYSYEEYDPRKVSLNKLYPPDTDLNAPTSVPVALNLFDMTKPDQNIGIEFGGVQFDYKNKSLRNNAYYMISGQLQGIIDWCKSNNRLLEFNFTIGPNASQLALTASHKTIQ